MKKVVFTARELAASDVPADVFIIRRLIQEGAPLRVTRRNWLDVTPFRKGEIIYEGEVTRYRDDNTGSIVYEFKKGA